MAKQNVHTADGAERTTLAVRHPQAAGIDVGDATHWVCIDADGGDAAVREFPAHTAGLRLLVAWLRQHGVADVALEATGAYGHVLFLTLLEAGFHVVTTAPTFTRQIKGRPKTDRRDCQWIQRLHRHGLLPSVFQPDEATQTLRDLVRQRASHVRLSGQHIQRMQKALELMNLKLTKVLGDVTGVTGLKILRAVVAGERDPVVLAQLRDRRCRRTAGEIATALDGRYRLEHVTELRLNLTMWEHYQTVIAELDEVIARQLHQMRKQTLLPPLPPKPRVRGKKPHDPRFNVPHGPVPPGRHRPDGHRRHRRDTRVDLDQRVGDRLHEVAERQAVHQLAGSVSQLEEDRRQGAIEQDAQGEEPRRRCVAPGGVEPDAQSQLFGRLPASPTGPPRRSQGNHRHGAQAARILYNLMRHGVAYMRKEEAAYAEQVRERLEKQLQRRARELGYELHRMPETVTTPDGEVLTVRPDGEIVHA